MSGLFAPPTLTEFVKLILAHFEPCQGSRFAFYFLALVAIVSTIRSLIHIFAPDGGANSIAGLAVDVAGGANIVAMFAQWGASQLILAIFYWLSCAIDSWFPLC